ncbi:alcohol dehydrogenase catalytic domain-containing protein [Micromonospora trifolii]|nr:alcohol dehydrogenase catalytic domain-containing protein [Micromonospora trifolii]
MRAVQLTAARKPPEIVTVPDPEPGPGQALVRVDAAGLCHSDLMLLDMPRGMLARNGIRLPLTLGHEAAGTVIAGTTLAPGTAVVLYGAWGCGTCRSCLAGRDNYCATPAQPPGLGSPGGLAEYLVADERYLLPIGDLDPVLAAPLADAALTPYHAIALVRQELTEGSTALVVGVGGLGHLAVQILRALTPAEVIAVDTEPAARELAMTMGAHRTSATVTDRADVIIDFVGTQETLDAAAAVVRSAGHIVIVGIGRGALSVGYDSPARGVSVSTTYWGTRPELREVIELAQARRITTSVENFTMDEAVAAYGRLRERRLTGRAVVVPHR